MEDLNVISYNCRGLPKSRRSLTLRPDIKALFNHCSILCLQEIWFTKQELKQLNNLHKEFIGIGTTKYDETEGLCNARGGVAIMYKKNLAKYIKQFQTNLDWCNAIEINIASRRVMIINVYMPYQCEQNRELYIQCLGALKSLIDDLPSTSFMIVGDWNANLKTGGNSLFGRLMVEFCNDNNLIISDTMLLPESSYTYISESSESTTWLDHIVSSIDIQNAISNISIAYDATDADHIPMTMRIKLELTPVLSNSSVDIGNNKTKWDSFSNNDITNYCSYTDVSLSKIKLHAESFACTDLNCKHETHKNNIGNLYHDITKSLIDSSEKIASSKNNNSMHRPGWNDHVADLYEASRETRLLWLSQGKPRHGPIFDIHIRTKLRVTYAIRYIKRNENLLRREALAKKLSSANNDEFWKEIHSINNCNTPLPDTINNVTGSDNIVELWRKHFYDIFNCLQKQSIDKSKILLASSHSEVLVTAEEIRQAINKLDLNKTCGADGIHAEHLKYSSDRILPLLSICITSMFTHGYLPSSMLSVVIVPLIKDKAGTITAKDNYRPIALASVLSKIIELIILDRIETCLLTSPNQFGFKRSHGTDQCIYAFKELIDYYTSRNSRVSVCFLDASKAFDRVNHSLLFNKLIKRGICGYLLRIIIYWYETQTMCVKWGNVTSGSFGVSNGVRQGGILSPLFFNVYVDDLSVQLNKLNIGCISKDMIINHLMYADDLVLISPSTAGLQELLDICQKFGIEHDMIFNPKKSAVMFFKPSDAINLSYPDFTLNSGSISIVDEYKYLGYIICDNLSDEKDIDRQKKKYTRREIYQLEILQCAL